MVTTVCNICSEAEASLNASEAGVNHESYRSQNQETQTSTHFTDCQTRLEFSTLLTPGHDDYKLQE